MIIVTGIEPSYLKLRNPESGATDEELKNLRSLEKQEQFQVCTLGRTQHTCSPKNEHKNRCRSKKGAVCRRSAKRLWGQKGKKDGFVEKIDKNNIQNVREDENVCVS